ncbi:MAG: DUF3306 domain-containing protein [Gammaproteobacteria bacterium]
MGRENKPEQNIADSQEEFLARWSRRKLDTRQDNPGATAGATDTAENSGLPAEEPEKVLTDADMLPIETLDGDSDYAPFLSAGVSDDLRRRAMRMLFSQPGFNITDGLNDYDEDYTQFTALGNVITHEMKRMLQRELEAEKKAAEESADVQTELAADSGVPEDEVTAAAKTVNTDGIETRTQDANPDKGDIPRS